MAALVHLMRKLEGMDPSLREVLLDILEEMEKQNARLEELYVSRLEFEELKKAVQELAGKVAELAEAQRRTEEAIRGLTERQDRLERALAELAEAQRRTEETVRGLTERQDRLEHALAELAEAQRRTEETVQRLAEGQERLEEGQRRLEERQERLEERQDRLERALAELAEAQRRTEEELREFKEETRRNFQHVWQAIAELTEAQRRTEEELKKLTTEHAETRRRLEGLSDTVGYTLENAAYRALPAILKNFGLEVEGRLIRKYVKVGRVFRQVNVYGHARRNGERLLILGEVKTRPSKKEIARFEKLADTLAQKEGLPVFRLFVAHDFPPDIEDLLRSRDILPVWSYELEG